MSIWYINSDGLMDVIDNITTFDVISDGHAVATKPDLTFYCKMVDYEWCLHKDDGPSVVSDNFGDGNLRYFFYVNGVNVNIEDLPCDNDIKLYLTIKYECDGTWFRNKRYK